MGAFYGTYTHSVDAKGRFSLPARIRQALPPEAPNSIVLVLGLEPCFYGFSEPDFYRMQEKIGALGMGSTDARGIMEVFGGSATFCEVDAQGRVLVLPKTLEIVGIKNEITIVGAVKFLSLWDPQKYAERLTDLRAAYAEGMRRYFSEA